MDLKTFQEIPPWEWPSNAATVFKTILLNKRAKESDRVIAAGLAGDWVAINDDLANILMEIVRNPEEPEELRAKAAVSLGPVLEGVDTMDFDDPDDEPPITEETFHKIQRLLQTVYEDDKTPKYLRRRILEAAVRAPLDWQREAIRRAYYSGDKEWLLTAVFCMQYIRAFDDEILESLNNPDPYIHRHAIEAAGNWELDAAWKHVVALAEDPETDKDLLLAAIGAVSSIRPREAGAILMDLTDSEDDETAEAAKDAMMMADAASNSLDTFDEQNEEDEGAGNWVH